METQTELTFKCRFVKNNAAMGLSAQKAAASQTELVIGEDRIPYSAISIAHHRENRVAFNLLTDVPLSKKAQKAVGDERVLVLEVQGKQGGPLAQHVNRIVSRLMAERRRQELAQAGQSERFRTVVCPHCGATIDCSFAEVTRYTYCHFCHSLLLTRDLTVVSAGDIYQQCPTCSLYGRVRKYTSFYFYFLVIVYGFSYQPVYVCDTCAAKLAKRNLLINLIFLLGVPPAIVMWIRALSGRDAALKALDKANQFAAKGDYARSDEIYTTLLQDQPDHPAILMNQAMAHFNGQDAVGGAALLQRILSACSNYAPALLWAARMQQAAKIAPHHQSA